jgi:hypothetical protein
MRGFRTAGAIMGAAVLMASPVHAEITFPTVEWWLADCRADSHDCLTYLNGLVQGLTFEDMVAHDSHPPGEFCDATKATIQQIAEVLRDYVKRHPTKLDIPVATILRLAMSEAFCH